MTVAPFTSVFPHHVAVQDVSVVLNKLMAATKGTKQERTDDGAPAVSHPDWNPHPIQGWTTDFIPLVLQEAIDNNFIDEIVPVAGADGIKWSQRLAAHEGILTGISGGSTFAVAMEVANNSVVTTLPPSMPPSTMTLMPMHHSTIKQQHLNDATRWGSE